MLVRYQSLFQVVGDEPLIEFEVTLNTDHFLLAYPQDDVPLQNKFLVSTLIYWVKKRVMGVLFQIIDEIVQSFNTCRLFRWRHVDQPMDPPVCTQNTLTDSLCGTCVDWIGHDFIAILHF